LDFHIQHADLSSIKAQLRPFPIKPAVDLRSLNTDNKTVLNALSAKQRPPPRRLLQKWAGQINDVVKSKPIDHKKEIPQTELAHDTQSMEQRMQRLEHLEERLLGIQLSKEMYKANKVELQKVKQEQCITPELQNKINELELLCKVWFNSKEERQTEVRQIAHEIQTLNQTLNSVGSNGILVENQKRWMPGKPQ